MYAELFIHMYNLRFNICKLYIVWWSLPLEYRYGTGSWRHRSLHLSVPPSLCVETSLETELSQPEPVLPLKLLDNRRSLICFFSTYIIRNDCFILIFVVFYFFLLRAVFSFKAVFLFQTYLLFVVFTLKTLD